MQIKHHLWVKQICWYILMWGQQGMVFFTGRSIILDYALIFWPEEIDRKDRFVSYKHSVSLHKTWIDGLMDWWSLVDYCDVFIGCLDSRSDGTHSLQRIQEIWSMMGLLVNIETSLFVTVLCLCLCYFYLFMFQQDILLEFEGKMQNLREGP